ncbi:MFS transporter [Wenyingzhuangia aestuarii]|uniref:MFS transporter n=1 Tax=Wenyingzhuangia aestuarii TaxID=1647582 RepID=UPI001438D801|nr:MFS transporter [Wenyingzhuangia aestuarii]NJB83852.1 DHA1 family arabinose polymer transporter-like MFS transporter [Wenyingzhuangia aestuarii]
MKKELLPLALGGLSIGTTEFVMMGLLPTISEYFNITISEAGGFISLYALGVVIGAPLIVFLSGRFSSKNILIGLMILFTLFNLLSALSPNTTFMYIFRFLSGLPHGAFFGVGSIVASRLAKKGEEAKNISMMFAGLTIANLVMVPLGTFLGQAFSWRITLGIVAFIGLMTLLSLFFWLPNLPIRKQTDIKGELSFFKTKEAWIITLMTAIGTGGGFAWLSYIAPLMTKVAGVSENYLMGVMMLVGLGMFVGNIIGGRLADKISPIKSCIVLFVAISVNLLLMFLFAQYSIIALILCFTGGACFLALGAPIQILMIKTAGKAEMVAAGVTQAAFNVGNSLGAFLGGVILTFGFGYKYPSLLGAVLALIGVGFTLLLLKTKKSRAV